MLEYKILDSIEESQYVQEEKCPYSDNCSCTDLCDRIPERNNLPLDLDIKLYEELEKHRDVKKQAGYSKLRQCEYISIVIVLQKLADGEFLGYSARSTCLLKKDGNFKDSNNNSDIYGEYTENIVGAYHLLPDGKIVEFLSKTSYENEIEEIYTEINTIRQYYALSEKLQDKDTLSRRHKI